MTDTEFSVMSVEEIREIRNKDKEDKLDHEWAKRISTVPVGAGWKMVRPDEEYQRNFKRRIGDAARASGRTLDWYPQETNLPPNVEPKTYVVRVKAHDPKVVYVPPTATDSQNGTGGSQEAPQTTGDQNGTPDTSDQPETAERRRR